MHIDLENLFKLINEFINTLSKIAWPIFAFVFMFVFKKHIVALLPRVKKVKIGGQEFELEELRVQVNKTEDEFQRRLNDEKSYKKITLSGTDDEQEILKTATANPELSIIQLSVVIEKNLRLVANILGFTKVKNVITISQIFQMLAEKGDIPINAVESLKIFWSLRNAIVHGKSINDNKLVLEVLDLGMQILKFIKNLPYPVYVVFKSNIDLFRDEELKNRIEGVKGILIEPRTISGTKYDKRILPTTKLDYYKENMFITWQFNLENVWDRTYYLDPISGEVKSAWDSSGEFIGEEIKI
jgi:uncharacterized protein YutE (UPF0331/DUF86 family)